MKATPLAAFASVVQVAILAAFCAFQPTPASAQADRANIFAVAGVQVDETAANGAAAQNQGLASAQRIGFERLARRLTSAQDQARLGVPAPDAAALDRLALSVDVENERRSGTRYIARLTVRYNAEAVRSLLRTAGYSIIETRSAPILIAPVGDASLAPETLAAWRAAWSEGGYGQELIPLAVAPENAVGGDWASLQPYAQAEAAGSAIVATLRVQGNAASATLREVSPAGARDRGVVSATIAGADAGALRTALQSLARQASDSVQNDWKARSGGGVGPVASRARVSASALYADQREWERIKSALEGAASTVISQIRIEAVGRQGALVSFSFTGERAQLGAELNRRGVSLEDSSSGPVLRAAPAH